MIALGACGDDGPELGNGLPLGPANELQIVAHQDDDLIFMQPDLTDAIVRGSGAVNVYVTAGNANKGTELADQRYTGLMVAYASLVGASRNDWSCGWIEIAGQPAEHCRLEAAKLSLVFLGYPDGLKDGSKPTSLLHLWEGKVDNVATVAHRRATYGQADLIATVAEVIDTVQPHLVRTLEVASTHGRDHSDHMVVGALAVLAVAASHAHPELIAYRGYNIDGEPETAEPVLFDRSADALLRYTACTDGCAKCGEPCPMLDETHDAWLRRRYAIGMRRAVDGVLQLGGQCLTTPTTGGPAALGDCATAPTWHINTDGNLVASTGLCLEVQATGDLTAAVSCVAGPARTMFFDDDGHLWAGIPPAPSDDMEVAHLWCLANSAGQPRAVLCGADNAPTWQALRPITVTARAATGLTQTGRAVRFGEPGLCEIAAGRLTCAAVAADGTIGTAAPIDDAAAPLAVVPQSLVLGDIDGDGHDDACGRDGGGLLCATAATGFHAARWSTLLAGSGAATDIDRSLSIVQGKPCAFTGLGAACIQRNALTLDVLSPHAGPIGWLGELDADGGPDWCFTTQDGPLCGVAAERDVTFEPVTWGYAFGGVVETPPMPAADLAGLGDVDGDGRADLCGAIGATIACSRSLARGFSPRSTLAVLPFTPIGLWQHGARFCAGDTTQIACTR